MDEVQYRPVVVEEDVRCLILLARLESTSCGVASSGDDGPHSGPSSADAGGSRGP